MSHIRRIMQIRQFDDDDWPVVSDWFRCRGLPIPDRTLIPSTAFVVTRVALPVAFAVLYVDGDVGVGHIDWLATRPGMSLGLSAKAIKILLEGMEATGKSLFPDDFLMIGCVRSEAMANWAAKAGFTPTEQVHMILKHSSHDCHTTRSVAGDHSSGSRDAILSPAEGG